MAWTKEKVVALITKGISNSTNTELVNAITFIKGTPPTGGCSTCFRRKAVRQIIQWYEKL